MCYSSRPSKAIVLIKILVRHYVRLSEKFSGKRDLLGSCIRHPLTNADLLCNTICLSVSA